MNPNATLERIANLLHQSASDPEAGQEAHPYKRDNNSAFTYKRSKRSSVSLRCSTMPAPTSASKLITFPRQCSSRLWSVFFRRMTMPNNAAHTPGPWQVQKDGYGVYYVNPLIEAGDEDIVDPQHDSVIARVDGTRVDPAYIGIDDDTLRANARLIAAAPEMRDMLQDMVDILWTAAGSLRWQERQCADAHISQARALLARINKGE